MKKKTYTAPVLTVVEFRSERGFANTGIVVPEVGTFELFYDQPGGQETESFITHDTWTDGSDNFWL
ncbi:MAG: hypothetical protein IKN29_05450 [Bacteroidales bacterium]|nr:hypothetical protein [Bacteroidales bacterium]